MTRKQPLLVVVLAAIAVTAALGIYALAVPRFGDLQAKVLATSASVMGAGILALACMPAWERGRLRLVSAVGAATAVVGFVLVVVAAWGGANGNAYWRATGSVLTLAAASTLTSLLSLARLAPRYRWSFPVAAILTGVLAAVIVGGLWAEASSSGYLRVLGVVALLVAAMTLVVPVLHRASADELSALEPQLKAVRFCPACGRELVSSTGAPAPCPACGARFRVRFLGE